mgnify:CR=1 FL=1
MKFKKTSLHLIATTAKEKTIVVIWNGRNIKVPRNTQIEKDDFIIRLENIYPIIK